ncbi:MAG: cytochrome c [Gemmatimonadetes bacterium]|nr:cytochrome c [Gemmatimonadota bacterium]
MDPIVKLVYGRRGRGVTLAAWIVILSACRGIGPQGPEPASPGGDQTLVAYGAEVYGYSCGRCHNPRAAAERTDEEWAPILTHMRVRANLTGRQARAVMAFLTAVNPEAPSRVDTLVVSDTIVRIDTVVVVQQAAERPPEPRPQQPAIEPPAAPRTEAPRPARPSELDPAEARRRAIEQGRRLIATKGCAGCHVVEGKGGALGPSLDNVFRRRDEAYVRRKTASPQLDNPNSVMPPFNLAPADLDAILAYLRSIQRGQR